MAGPLVVQGLTFTNSWTDYLEYRERFNEALDITHTIEWVDQKVWDCSYRLFSNKRAAILVEITGHPSGVKSVDGVLAAGELEEIQELIVLAEQWGRDQGAAFASIDSRPGWARLLPDYTVDQVRIVKEL